MIRNYVILSKFYTLKSNKIRPFSPRLVYFVYIGILFCVLLSYIIKSFEFIFNFIINFILPLTIHHILAIEYTQLNFFFLLTFILCWFKIWKYWKYLLFFIYWTQWLNISFLLTPIIGNLGVYLHMIIYYWWVLTENYNFFNYIDPIKYVILHGNTLPVSIGDVLSIEKFNRYIISYDLYFEYTVFNQISNTYENLFTNLNNVVNYNQITTIFICFCWNMITHGVKFLLTVLCLWTGLIFFNKNKNYWF